MSAEDTEGLKEAQLEITKTMTEMKSSIPHQPRDMWDGRKPKAGKVPWTKRNDNMLLLAATKSENKNNAPDWDTISNMLGRDSYPPDELQDRFHYLVYKRRMICGLSRNNAATRVEEAAHEEKTIVDGEKTTTNGGETTINGESEGLE